ncbi:Npun_R2821/Npun_R2822 family protein [Umezakia ovalisporum]|uniref:Sugar transferase n=2 Tax=Umezakia ovalisporum TaxID=75695 RepID=A0AA43GZ95_9CYAN|nr:Npun_R2821/Npun_R2822 family protein [Umezakia ovalisporum]MDH6058340.1 sugar transferase [Umezakia ovalisporum FSS-43]MDH6063932.1 sugar transferase [Umezakia ovalisporum FSS-62]MDH6067687.1 sugar transferase [Umezakia ovalisporum APH033B]MDH6071487.1 sugar transferase [Umezakia ovalisporum CobakiLakeA]MDH6073171.1 sugar transferase [Umezakia ovalisporum CS-1034]
MIDGIYTLANDIVYDQLIALLNSIEVNAGREIPVCVIPYDQRLDKVQAEVARRDYVTLFENSDSIAYWDNFATQVWKNYPRAQTNWRKRGWSELYRLPMHRKLCGLHGSFDKFIYFDADTLLMGSIDYIYEKLDSFDWVVHDFQYKSELKYIFDAGQQLLDTVFADKNLQNKVFCAGWFATKKQVFPPEMLANLLEKLNAGEAEVMAVGGPDQSLFNYMVLRSGISYYNFAYHDPERGTGTHWSSQFEMVDNVLYDGQGRLTYLHYMSIAASKFTQLCLGQDIQIPYRDVFLHYRYLKSPEERPKTFKRESQLVCWQKTSTSFFNQKLSNIKARISV